MTTNANSMQDASESAGAALSLVAEPSSQLTTRDVAQRLSKSLAWVKSHARELGGTIVAGAYVFPSVEIERRRTVTTSERFTLGGQRAPEPPDLGRRAAAVLERLETGAQAVRIAIELQEPPDFVLRVREQWLRAHAADREGLAFPCSCGSPSDPHTAKCVRCFSRTRTLTDAEALLLAGTELPEPNTIACNGCATIVRNEAVDALCGQCRSRLTIDVRGGVLVVVLAGTVVRELTIAETRDLMPPLAHHLPPPPAAVPVKTEDQ